MNKHSIFLGCCLFFVVANFYFYYSNTLIQQAVSETGDNCGHQLARLHARLASRPVPPVKNERAEYAVDAQPTLTSETAASLPEVDLENMVSYKHRIQAVINKYDFLLETAQLPESDKKRLRRLLTERERLANAIAFAEHDPNADLINLDDAFYEVEDQIFLLLKDPIDYHRYEYLKQRKI